MTHLYKSRNIVATILFNLIIKGVTFQIVLLNKGRGHIIRVLSLHFLKGGLTVNIKECHRSKVSTGSLSRSINLFLLKNFHYVLCLQPIEKNYMLMIFNRSILDMECILGRDMGKNRILETENK